MRCVMLVLLGCVACDLPHRVTLPRTELSRLSDRGEVVLVARGRPELIEVDCVRIPAADLSLGFTPHGRRLLGGCDAGQLSSLVERAERDPRWSHAELEFRRTSGRQVAAGMIGGAIGIGLGTVGAYLALRCQPMSSAEDDACDGHDVVAPFAYVLLGALGGIVGHGAGSLVMQDHYRLR